MTGFACPHSPREAGVDRLGVEQPRSGAGPVFFFNRRAREMSLASRIVTLMTGITVFQVRAMPPVERLRLAHECRRLLLIADPPVRAPRVATDATPRRPRSGVLADLADGERGH
jgi:hypothetical protein